MTADKVLTWMSARREGSWEQFTKKVGDLCGLDSDGKQYWIRNNLIDLGHCEFAEFAEREGGDKKYGWKTTPPVLVSTQFEGGMRGILCGARYSELEKAIERSVPAAEMSRSVMQNAPGAIFLRADSLQKIYEVAESCGILFENNPAEKILLALPPVQAPAWEETRTKLSEVAGWDPKRFDSSTLDWCESSFDEVGDAASGLFRVTEDHRSVYLMKMEQGDRVTKLPAEVAYHRILQKERRPSLRYDQQERVLSMPAIGVYRPPPLIRRALVLCSGILPMRSKEKGKMELRYSNVPGVCAELVANLLGQRLK